MDKKARTVHRFVVFKMTFQKILRKIIHASTKTTNAAAAIRLVLNKSTLLNTRCNRAGITAIQKNAAAPFGGKVFFKPTIQKSRISLPFFRINIDASAIQAARKTRRPDGYHPVCPTILYRKTIHQRSESRIAHINDIKRIVGLDSRSPDIAAQNSRISDPVALYSLSFASLKTAKQYDR